jgi:hypothetical protein
MGGIARVLDEVGIQLDLSVGHGIIFIGRLPISLDGTQHFIGP